MEFCEKTNLPVVVITFTFAVNAKKETNCTTPEDGLGTIETSTAKSGGSTAKGT